MYGDIAARSTSDHSTLSASRERVRIDESQQIDVVRRFIAKIVDKTEGKTPMTKSSVRIMLSTSIVLAIALCAAPSSADHFKVGYAECDITPEKPVPMWGYGDRHDALSKGVRDPLEARAMVIDVGETKLAIVGMDIGRAPTRWMMPGIREAVKTASGVGYVMIAGSHTHHGPVIELQDKAGKGKDRFDDSVAYSKQLEGKLIDVINAAAGAVQDARIGWGVTQVDFNRNRHTKIEPKPRDRDLSVVRIDDAQGKPYVILVNFAAHPTSLSASDLRFSWEYPGFIVQTVEKKLDAHCVFMQGAAGDMSCQKPKGTENIEGFGDLLGKKALELVESIETKTPETPSLDIVEDEFAFESRVDLTNPLVQMMFQQAFFPELVSALDEMDGNTLYAPMTTALLNKELAIVTGPGEFFCNHSLRVKERSRAAMTLFFGYCNGHNMYYPTIEAAAEGGYGADALVAWVELGAGERMMDKALINLYTMLGKYPSIMDLIAQKR